MRRALVVDADAACLTAASATLSEAGYVVLSAQALPFAAYAFAGMRLELIVLEALETLTQDVATAKAQWPDAPIIVALTDAEGRPVRTQLFEARALGAVGGLIRPYDSAQVLRAIEAAKRPAASASTPHVLVIDDSRTVLSVCRMALSDARMKVTLAANVEEALEVLDLSDVSCVVTDIFMPGRGGIEGTMEISRRRPDLPIVAMSGGLDEKMSGEMALAAARRIGARATLAKPFRPEALVFAVRNAMAAPAPAAAAKIA